MKRILTFSVVLGLVASVASVAEAQIIIGGSTNNGYLDRTIATEISPGNFLPKPDGWVYTGTRAISGAYQDGLSSEPWSGPAPTPVTTGNLLNPPFPEGCGNTAVDGDCGVFFKAFTGGTADGPATVHLHQDNPATAGLKYGLSGWAGAEANFLAAGAEIALEFLDGGGGVIGGSTINLLPTLFVDNGLSFDYKLYSTMAVAPAGTTTVRARASMIGGMPNPLGGGQAFVVDDFTLGIVPEPATVGLVLIGSFALLGSLRRR
jgi:hypothetical protein